MALRGERVAGVLLLNNFQYHFGPLKNWLLHFKSKKKKKGVF